MSTTHHEQEFTPERNGQENSPSHSAQDNGDSDSDTVQERAPERDMPFSFQVAPPGWFTDYMSVTHNKLDSLNKNIKAIDIRLQNSIQAAEQWLTALKQRPQFVGSVATTTTFSQQSSVCSTVKNAPPVYQTIPYLSTPSPACYPYQNAPNLARKTNLGDQSQSVLQVTCHMPVPPPSHIPIAHSTSPGMAQASNNPVAQSTSQGMSHNTPSSTQVLAAEVGSSSNSKGTVRSPQRRSPSSQYSFPKGSESPIWRERSSSPTQYTGSMSPNWREKNHSSFKPEQGSMTSAIQNGSSRRSSSIIPSRNKTYSQCYGCREYGHHRYECPRRNISPSRRWSGRNSSNSPPRARYPRPGERL